LDTLNSLTDNSGNYKFYKELLAYSLSTHGYAVPHLGMYNSCILYIIVN